MATNEESVETLELLVGNKDSSIQYLVYGVLGLGDFRRENGKWIPHTEDTEDQFDDMRIFTIDMNKASDFVAKWDAEGKVSVEEVSQFEASKEAEQSWTIQVKTAHLRFLLLKTRLPLLMRLRIPLYLLVTVRLFFPHQSGLYTQTSLNIQPSSQPMLLSQIQILMYLATTTA